MVVNKDHTPQGTRLGLYLAGGLLLAAVAGIVGLYGMRGIGRNGEVAGGSCAATKNVAQRIEPLARGEVAMLKVPPTPTPVVNLAFTSPDGQPLKLSDFRGRTVLLNLWATWCPPCRAEMPALNRLQQELGGPDFEVVAVNIDAQRPERPKAFLQSVGVQSLAYYSDQSGVVFADLKKAGKAFGMPSTLLIDKHGCELGVMAGPAEWSSQDAVALVRAALGR